MQLNEIIEENTLESISRKTRLSSENLEKLFARDFGAFRKVQALGFISILEREYRADLSDLRAECVAYFSEGSPVEKTQKEAEVSPKKSPKKAPIMDSAYRKKTPAYLKPALIGLIALGLLYGAWQTLLTNTTQDANLTQNQKSGFFASIVQQAQSWIGGEDNTSDSDALPEANQGAWEKDSNQTKPSLVVAETPKRPHTEDQSDTAESKDAQKESAIIRKVKAQQAQAIAAQKAAELETMQKVDNAIANAGDDSSVREKPLATEVPSASEASPEANSGENAAEKAATKVMETADLKQAEEEAAQKKAAEAARLKAEREQAAAKAAQERAAAAKAARLEAERAAQEKAARLQAAKQKAAQEKAARLKAAKLKAAKEKAARLKAAKLKAAKEKAAKLKAAKEKAAAEAAAAKGKIVIRPRAKIWIGKVNLATMQRSTVTTDKPFTLDNLKGRWIVATGHGRFSLKIGSRVFNYNDSKKHFLIIQKGTAHEIPHATFQKLNQSKVW